jgi:ATPase family associated with various cellular activities (AAA)
MHKFTQLLTDMKLFDTDNDEIERRFETFLREIRDKKFRESKDSNGENNLISWADKNKIRRRSQKIIDARRKYGQGQHLTRADRKMLKPVLNGVTLDGPATEHSVDEIAATLFAEMPWMQAVVNELWLDMRHHVVVHGKGLKIRPTLLEGGAGLGKTHLVRRLADLCRLPTVHIDGGSSSEGFPVAGLSRGWSGAECGKPLKTMLAKSVGNPLVIVDEVDKAGVGHSKNGSSTSLHSALLGLLEPVSSKDWACPYFQ